MGWQSIEEVMITWSNRRNLCVWIQQSCGLSVYTSFICRDGKGAYTQIYGGWFLIDVYEITNELSFSDSGMQLNASNATTELMTNGTGSGHALTYNLALLISAILTAKLVIALLYYDANK